MRNRYGPRRRLAALAAGSCLALLIPGAVLAEAPHHVMINDAACNQGTAAARVISGNGIVPMYMVSAPVGCMTMPGAFNGP